MTVTIDLSDDLKARIEAIAARSRLSPSEVIANALETGRSLEWQEQYLDRVASGLAEAEQGRFAGEGYVRTLIDRYRPA